LVAAALAGCEEDEEPAARGGGGAGALRRQHGLRKQGENDRAHTLAIMIN
jgi:hypothetical protein